MNMKETNKENTDSTSKTRIYEIIFKECRKKKKISEIPHPHP